MTTPANSPAVVLPLSAEAVALVMPLAGALQGLDKLPPAAVRQRVGAAFKNALAELIDNGLLDDVEIFASEARGKDIICTIGENLPTAKSWAFRAVLKVMPARRDALAAFLDARLAELRASWPEIKKMLYAADEAEQAAPATPAAPDPQSVDVPNDDPDDDAQPAQVPA